MRWLITALYVGLVISGVLDMNTIAFALSASSLIAYDIAFTWQRLYATRTDPRFLTSIRYFDIVVITTILVAVHDVRNPVWSVYFVSITAVAHLVTKREMTMYVAWIGFNYLIGAAAVQAMGYHTPWAYVIVVSICIQLMGLNASLLAGGEQRLRDVMRQAAITDSLTGLPNRHHFHERYTLDLETAIADGVPLALMLLDVDHFKDINDRKGHPAGDDKLRDVAHGLQSAIRADDLVARYGGDEFIVVAPHTSRDDALHLAERLRVAARESEASVSIGVAIFPQDAATQDELIEAADAALYRAKQAGRNCVRDGVAA